MTWIQVEGTLDNVRLARRAAGVEFAGRALTPVGGDRFRIEAMVDEAVAVPAIEALGCIVRVLHSEEDLERLALMHRDIRDRNIG